MEFIEKLSVWEIVVVTLLLVVVASLIIKIVLRVLDIRKIKKMRYAIDQNVKIRKPIIFTTFDRDSDVLPLIVHDLYHSCSKPTETVCLVCLPMHDFKLFYQQVKDINWENVEYRMVHRHDGNEITAFFYPTEIDCLLKTTKGGEI